jgi:hypothetical protein
VPELTLIQGPIAIAIEASEVATANRAELFLGNLAVAICIDGPEIPPTLLHSLFPGAGTIAG